MSLTKVSYSMIKGAPINVLDYGAFGDGTNAVATTAAFQAAFAKAKADGGGKIVAPYGTYLFNAGFGTDPTNSTDLCENVEVDGCGSTFLCNYATVVGGMRFITLEGTNNTVRNIVFDSGHTYPMDVNPFTDGPRDKYIDAICIGGKAASYFQQVDTLANYKEFATVENCTFNYINRPILITQVSHGLVKNNRLNYWTETGVIVWNCPDDIIISDNQMQYGYDDAIFLFNCRAGTPSVPLSGGNSAWTAAGLPAGNHKVVDNYLAWTRAKCFGTAGYSDIVFANNHCRQSQLENILIESLDTIWANGNLYNRNILITGNLLEYGGGYWNAASTWIYFRGPVSGEASAIGFKNNNGVLPRDIHIVGNIITTPVENGVNVTDCTKLSIMDNVLIAGVNPYNSGTTLAYAVSTSATVNDVVICNNKIIGDQGDTWLTTYNISPNGVNKDVRIMRNYAGSTGETFSAGTNFSTNPSINYDSIPSDSYTFSRYNYAATANPVIAFFGAVGEGPTLTINKGGTGTQNVSDASMKVWNSSISGRSINASGTINASGADYAEYMTKAGDFTITKGDICGIDADGKLTNVFADAVTFVVKSTAPSYVGGDNWATIQTWIDRNSITPEERAKHSKDELEKMLELTDEERNLLDQQRQHVDRVAFAGQVPVNVYGAAPGQHIVPVNDNGAIKGIAVSNPTFEQYQSSIGKVIAVEEDGRARVIVKVV